MIGRVQIGEHGVDMLATASTPYRLKQIFGIDYFQVVTAKKQPDATEMTDLYIKLGFVMAKQAEKADMNAVNEAAFFDWLDQFEPLEVALAVNDISNIYDSQAKSTAVPKSQAGE